MNSFVSAAKSAIFCPPRDREREREREREINELSPFDKVHKLYFIVTFENKETRTAISYKSSMV